MALAQCKEAGEGLKSFVLWRLDLSVEGLSNGKGLFFGTAAMDAFDASVTDDPEFR